MSAILSNAAKIAACQAIINLINTDHGADSGTRLSKIVLYQNTTPLVELKWAAAVIPFQAPDSNGVSVANPPQTGTATADGIINKFEIKDPNNVTVISGGACQRYVIASINASGDSITVSGNLTSIFTPRRLIELVDSANQSNNIFVHVDNAGSTISGDYTIIPIFEDIAVGVNWNFVHPEILGLDNDSIKIGQSVNISSLKYTLVP